MLRNLHQVLKMLRELKMSPRVAEPTVMKKDTVFDSLRPDDRRHLLLLLQHLGLEEAILGDSFKMADSHPSSASVGHHPSIGAETGLKGSVEGQRDDVSNPAASPPDSGQKLPYLGLGQHFMSFSRLASSIVPSSLKQASPQAAPPEGGDRQSAGHSRGESVLTGSSGAAAIPPPPRFSRAKAAPLFPSSTVDAISAATNAVAVSKEGTVSSGSSSGRQEALQLMTPPVPRHILTSQLYYVQVIIRQGPSMHT